MTKFNSAYDTTAGCGYRMGATEERLKEASIYGAFGLATFVDVGTGDNRYVSLVQGGQSVEDNVPFFAHPYYFKGANGQNVLALDVRAFGKWMAPQRTFVVRNHPEYLWNVKRAVVNHFWINERPEALRDLSGLPAEVYASLISEAVARKYALDPADQITISILACYHYFCLFTDDGEFEEAQRLRILGRVAQLTRAPAQRVTELLSDVPTIRGLEGLCEAVRTKTGSVRLNDFNVGVLIAIVAGNWYGNNSRENLAVGLEHVPTWLMIIYASLNEATFKKSVLAKMVERLGRNGSGQSFSRALDNLIQAGSIKFEQDPIDQF